MLDLCFFSNRTPRTNVRCFREETAQSKKAEAVQSVEMGMRGSIASLFLSSTARSPVRSVLAPSSDALAPSSFLLLVDSFANFYSNYF